MSGEIVPQQIYDAVAKLDEPRKPLCLICGDDMVVQPYLYLGSGDWYCTNRHLVYKDQKLPRGFGKEKSIPVPNRKMRRHPDA